MNKKAAESKSRSPHRKQENRNNVEPATRASHLPDIYYTDKLENQNSGGNEAAATMVDQMAWSCHKH